MVPVDLRMRAFGIHDRHDGAQHIVFRDGVVDKEGLGNRHLLLHPVCLSGRSLERRPHAVLF
jgi:hypothetical protein